MLGGVWRVRWPQVLSRMRLLRPGGRDKDSVPLTKDAQGIPDVDSVLLVIVVRDNGLGKVVAGSCGGLGEGLVGDLGFLALEGKARHGVRHDVLRCELLGWSAMSA